MEDLVRELPPSLDITDTQKGGDVTVPKRKDATVVPEPLSIKITKQTDFEFGTSPKDGYGSPDSFGMTEFIREIDNIVKEAGISTTPKSGASSINSTKSWDKYDSVDQEDFLSWLGDGKVDTSTVLHKDDEDVLDNTLALVVEERVPSTDNTKSTKPISTNSSPPTCPSPMDIQNRQNSLLEKLSGELQDPDNASPHQIIQLCQQLGGIPTAMRGATWKILLRISKGENGKECINESYDKHQSDEMENACLIAMAESASIRLERFQIKDSACDKEEHVLWDASVPTASQENVLPEDSAPCTEAVRVLVKQYCNVNKVRVSECDPGIADVLHLLAWPTLDFEHDEIVRAAQVLQKFKLLALAEDRQHQPKCSLVSDENSSTNLRTVRNRRCEKQVIYLLKLHDEQLGCALEPFVQLKNGVKRLDLPWRWWACAFAGELPPAPLLILWDELIMDCSPVRQEDDGQSGEISAEDTCDPRGPLLLYCIVVMLTRNRELLLKLLQDPDTSSTSSSEQSNTSQIVIDTLKKIAENMNEVDVAEMAQEAHVLRNSTPLSDATRHMLNESSSTTASKNVAIPTTATSEKKPFSFSDKLKLKFGIGSFRATSLSSKAVSSPTKSRFSLDLEDSSSEDEEQETDVDEEAQCEDGTLEIATRVSSEVIDPAILKQMEVEKAHRAKVAQARHHMNGCQRGLVPWEHWVKQGGLINEDTVLVPAQQKCSFSGSLADIIEWEDCFILIVFNRVISLRIQTNSSEVTNGHDEESTQCNVDHLKSLSGTELADALCKFQVEVVVNVHGSQFSRTKVQDQSDGSSFFLTLFYIDYETLGSTQQSPDGFVGSNTPEPEQSMCQISASSVHRQFITSALEDCNCFT